MNTASQTETSPTAMRLAAEYKARQARFAAAARKAANRNRYEPLIVETITKAEEEETPIIRLIVHVRSFDEHVKAYRILQKDLEKVGHHRLRKYILHRAHELGVTYSQIIGAGRKREVVAARQLVMWEIKTIIKPEASYPEVGRLFGDRDHTTVLHAVRRVEAMKARVE